QLGTEVSRETGSDPQVPADEAEPPEPLTFQQILDRTQAKPEPGTLGALMSDMLNDPVRSGFPIDPPSSNVEAFVADATARAELTARDIKAAQETPLARAEAYEAGRQQGKAEAESYFAGTVGRIANAALQDLHRVDATPLPVVEAVRELANRAR